MKKSLLAVLPVILALVAASWALADVKQIPVVRLEARTQIAASPQVVWRYLTTGRNLITWCPIWKNPANAKASLSKVGDVLDFTDQWGNGGRSIVTFLKPDQEIRIAHEPNNGSYLCQSRVVLTPAGAGTAVVYVEQYTDESAPNDLQATAAKVQAEMNESLALIRKGAEGK